MKLLTIIVPTFNRAQHLSRLLDAIRIELEGLGDLVDVVVGDNCSTDGTEAVTSTFKASCPGAIVLRHDKNYGADENFCRCIDRVRSRYFWIIGDDDLPRAGVVRQILEVLVTEAPDLIYLASDWRPELENNGPEDPVTALKPVRLDRGAFARRIHVWSTFISGMIVNRETFVAGNGLAWRQYSGTSLVQLGWVLGSIKTGRRFLYLSQKCVLATQGNTGGYSVLKVFGNNFPSITAEIFGPKSRLAIAMTRRFAVGFLPDLIWSLRFEHLGDFAPENAATALRTQLGRSASFWLLLMPIAHFPRPAARWFLGIAHLVARILLLHDRILERLIGMGYRSVVLKLFRVLVKGPGWLLTKLNSWLWRRILHAEGLEVQHGCLILGAGNIRIGQCFRAGRLLWLEAVTRYQAQEFLPQLTIGNRVNCSDAVHIACTNSVTIGDDVLIGSKVHITDHNHGCYHGAGLQSSPDELPVSRALVGKPVFIGDRVFLADGVVVLPGSHIGAGTIVGANSVVSGTLPPDSIFAGVPARQIRCFDRSSSCWLDTSSIPKTPT